MEDVVDGCVLGCVLGCVPGCVLGCVPGLFPGPLTVRSRCVPGAFQMRSGCVPGSFPMHSRSEICKKNEIEVCMKTQYTTAFKLPGLYFFAHFDRWPKNDFRNATPGIVFGQAYTRLCNIRPLAESVWKVVALTRWASVCRGSERLPPQTLTPKTLKGVPL